MRSYSCIALNADCANQTDRWAIRCDSTEIYDLVNRKCVNENGNLVEKYPFTKVEQVIPKYNVVKTITAKTFVGGSFIPTNVQVEVGDMFMINRPQYFNQIQRGPGEMITATVNGMTTNAYLSTIKIHSSFPEIYPVVVRPFLAKLQHSYLVGPANQTVTVTVKNANIDAPLTSSSLVAVMAPITNMTLDCPQAGEFKNCPSFPNPCHYHHIHYFMQTCCTIPWENRNKNKYMSQKVSVYYM
jgi:hypothetical protein